MTISTLNANMARHITNKVNGVEKSADRLIATVEGEIKKTAESGLYKTEIDVDSLIKLSSKEHRTEVVKILVKFLTDNGFKISPPQSEINSFKISW